MPSASSNALTTMRCRTSLPLAYRIHAVYFLFLTQVILSIASLNPLPRDLADDLNSIVGTSDLQQIPPRLQPRSDPELLRRAGGLLSELSSLFGVTDTSVTDDVPTTSPSSPSITSVSPPSTPSTSRLSSALPPRPTPHSSSSTPPAPIATASLPSSSFPVSSARLSSTSDPASSASVTLSSGPSSASPSSLFSPTSSSSSFPSLPASSSSSSTPAPLSASHNKPRVSTIVAGTVIPLLVIAVLCGMVIVLHRRRRRLDEVQRPHAYNPEMTQQSAANGDGGGGGSLHAGSTVQLLSPDEKSSGTPSAHASDVADERPATPSPSPAAALEHIADELEQEKVDNPDSDASANESTDGHTRTRSRAPTYVTVDSEVSTDRTPPTPLPRYTPSRPLPSIPFIIDSLPGPVGKEGF